MSIAPSVRLPMLALVLGSLACLPGACAAGNDDDAGYSRGGGAGSDGGNAGQGGTIVVPEGGPTDVKLSEGGECIGETHPGKLTPLDIYILLDATNSMTGSGGHEVVWPSVTHALVGIIKDPASEGIGVGLTFFPVRPSPDTVFPKSCTKDSDCGLYGPCETVFCAGWASQDCSCVVSDYGKPVVDIGTLPGNAADLQAAIIGKTPDGSATPTQLALEGTLAYAHQWAVDHPSHLTAVLLATDGEPNNCTTNSVTGAAVAAEAAFKATPSVPTYVIGFGNIDVLNQVAASGGTGTAYLTNSSGAATKLVEMFNTIRSTGACQYEIPVPVVGEPDFDKVNVSFTPAGATEAQDVLQVANESECHADTGGWYYDDASAPKRILLCPASCQAVNKSHKGLTVLLGCKTKVY